MKTSLCVSSLLFVLSSAVAGAVELPVTTDFNSDVIGQPPAVGGPNQPTALFESPGTSITVQASAFGLVDQPVVLDSPNAEYVTVNWVFPEVSTGTVRCEATVAADRLLDGYFVQTASADDAVGARLVFLGSGEIRDQQSGTVVGLYSALSPFRVRLDVQPAAEEFCATIDDEMNGFDDDPRYCGLPVLNSGNFYPIAAFYGSLNPAGATQAAIAYDDILIEISIGIFADGFEAGDLSAWSTSVP